MVGLAFVLSAIVALLIQLSDLDNMVKGILTIQIFYIYFSVGEVYVYRRLIKLARSKSIWAKWSLARHTKTTDKILKYATIILKTAIVATLIFGFYQLFDRTYNHLVSVILHALIVGFVLVGNLYIDSFDRKWYRKLNINIIKDEFIQRKVITMLFFAIFVSVNAFIVFI